MAIYDITGKELAANNDAVEPDQYDIPVLTITGTLPTTKDQGELPISLKYKSKTLEFDCYGTLKVQGNSSTGFPKKNFTLKLYSDSGRKKKYKISFKGWGEQSKYVLKANWVDITHARNVVSARIWADIVKQRDYWASLPEELKTSPNQGAIDGFPVRIYANGVYQGRYTLNIPKDKWMVNMDDDLDTHCMLYSEDYVSGCFRASAVIDGNDWTDEIHKTVPSSILSKWNQIINFVMTSSDSDFTAHLSDYFDVDSLVDYYIYAYVSTGLDSMGKNQVYLTYDGHTWIASMYDMEGVWGMFYNGSKFVSPEYRMQEDYETGFNGTSNLLYDRLEALFGDRIESRYAELRDTVLSPEHIIDRFKEFTSITPQSIIELDYAPSTGGGKFTGIPSKTTNNIVQIRENVFARLKYVDEKISQLSQKEYTVYFVKASADGGGTLQTIEKVPYGTVVTAASAYTGATPTTSQGSAEDYPFEGWEPTSATIQGNTTFTAKFGGPVEKYNVYFVKASADGGETLQTIENVEYGTVITAASAYTGSTPTTSQGSAEDYPFEGWTPASATVTGNTTFTAKFGSPVEVKEITDSWETILANENPSATYSIGDTKEIDLGTEGKHLMEIVAFDEDDKADGSGKAKITWISKYLLDTTYKINSTEKTVDGETGFGIGGWEHCDLRSYLNTDIKAAMPTAVRNGIVSVTKTQSVYKNGVLTKNGQTTTDDIWIPSVREYKQSNTDYETTGATYEIVLRNYTKDGQIREHWTRSGSSKAGFAISSTVNDAYSSKRASNSSYIALGFCTD